MNDTIEKNEIDNIEIDNTPLTKPKRKHNAPRSQKQLENFEKARLKRTENVKLKKEAKELQMAKLYMENKLKQEEAQPKEIIEPVKKNSQKAS